MPNLDTLALVMAALPERALALWYAVGTVRCRFNVLPRRSGNPQAAFDGPCERGYGDRLPALRPSRRPVCSPTSDLGHWVVVAPDPDPGPAIFGLDFPRKASMHC